MSKATWNFSLAYSNSVGGDVVHALRDSGLGALESETIAAEMLETTELGIAIDRKSEVEPRLLLQNLKDIGLTVGWLNDPAT